MKPKPLASLNHFTVPCSMEVLVSLILNLRKLSSGAGSREAGECFAELAEPFESERKNIIARYADECRQIVRKHGRRASRWLRPGPDIVWERLLRLPCCDPRKRGVRQASVAQHELPLLTFAID